MTEIRFAVLDVETTGLDLETCEMCEIAFVVVSLDVSAGATTTGARYEWLINPGMPIPATASAVTHMIDEDVAHAPSATEVMHDVACTLRDLHVDALVAHNAEFDRGFVDRHLDESQLRPWLCSYRLGAHMYPDSPSHSLQVLRYHLGLDVDRCGPVHRAMFDADVTSKLLARMFADGLVDRAFAHVVGSDDPDMRIELAAGEVLHDLLELSSAPLLLKRMPFGKHRGEDFQSIPFDYIRWMLRQNFDDADLTHTVRVVAKARGGL